MHLAIKGPVQYVADRELAALIAPENGTIGTGSGVAGSVVVMDLRDGGIVAMANYPLSDPVEFIGAVSSGRVRRVQFQRSSEAPAQSCDLGTYPAASTCQDVHGLAALANGSQRRGERRAPRDVVFITEHLTRS